MHGSYFCISLMAALDIFYQRKPCGVKRNSFKMPQSSRFVRPSKSVMNVMSAEQRISGEVIPIFSSITEMKQSFIDLNLAVRSIEKLKCRAWEVSHDFY